MCENRAYTYDPTSDSQSDTFTYLDLTKKELLLGPKLTRHLKSISARSQPQ